MCEFAKYFYLFLRICEIRKKNELLFEKVEQCLKDGYYIDQWSLTGFQTPLMWAIYSGNTKMVELLLINGARRQIKRYLKALKGTYIGNLKPLSPQQRQEMIQLCSQYAHEDPCL